MLFDLGWRPHAQNGEATARSNRSGSSGGGSVHPVCWPAAHGCPRLALAAVPLRAGSESSSGLAEHAMLTALRASLGTPQGGAGLRQFKSAFAPRWERLYLAAPNRLALALAAVDIARRIARPWGRA